MKLHLERYRYKPPSYESIEDYYIIDIILTSTILGSSGLKHGLKHGLVNGLRAFSGFKNCQKHVDTIFTDAIIDLTPLSDNSSDDKRAHWKIFLVKSEFWH